MNIVPEKKLLKLAMYLEKRPKTISQILSKFNISRCTMYRYLKKLEDMGFEIFNVGFSRPVKYQARKK